MKPDSNIKILVIAVVIVIAMQIFEQCTKKEIALAPIESEINKLKEQNEISFKELQAIKDSISKIDVRQYVTKNYYQLKENEIDSIKSDDSLRNYIRVQLKELGSAEL